MRAGWRAWLTGLGVSLAIAFPATVVAQILDALGDDDLPVAVTVALSVIVLAGPVVGAFTAARRRRTRRGVGGVLLGAACLFVIAVFGAIRQEASGDEPTAFAIPVLVITGGLLGLIGDRAAAAGRTRS